MSEIEHYIGVNLTAGHDESQVKMLMGDLVHTLRDHPGVDYAVLMADGPEVEKERREIELGTPQRAQSLLVVVFEILMLFVAVVGLAIWIASLL